MFKILLPNTAKLSNPDLGLFNFNFIPQSRTSDERPKQYVFNGSKACSISILEVQAQWPVVFDVRHLEQSDAGRHNIEEILASFHNNTNHSMQVGFIQPWAPLNTEQTRQLIELPFQRNRYGKPNILKLIQFIVCGAYGYPKWDEWSVMLRASHEAASKYHKPIYASLTPTMYLTNKAIDLDKLRWIILEVYRHQYDGVILHSQKEDKYDVYYELLLTALNQINK